MPAVPENCLAVTGSQRHLSLHSFPRDLSAQMSSMDAMGPVRRPTQDATASVTIRVAAWCSLLESTAIGTCESGVDVTSVGMVMGDEAG